MRRRLRIRDPDGYAELLKHLDGTIKHTMTDAQLAAKFDVNRTAIVYHRRKANKGVQSKYVSYAQWLDRRINSAKRPGERESLIARRHWLQGHAADLAQEPAVSVFRIIRKRYAEFTGVKPKGYQG